MSIRTSLQLALIRPPLVGTFTVAADATLTTTTSSLTIDSETVTLNGNLRTNAGAANGLIDLNAGTVV